MINKKGELTTQQLVGIIILIISFVVILFFIFRLNLGETTDKEICHNSVVMKSQSVLGSGNLDCKTSYVCISGGDKCDNFNPSITRDIDMNQDDLKIKNDIMKAIADEMADCWWMFGEGKVDYVGGKLLGDRACALCSIIVFDKRIQNYDGLKEGFSLDDFYKKYLVSHDKDNGHSYLYYLYGTNSAEEINFPGEMIKPENQYSILTGIRKENVIWKVFSFPYFYTKSFFVDAEGKKTETGSLPVRIIDKQNMGSLECDEFVTKA